MQKFYDEWAQGIKKIRQMKTNLSDEYIKELVNNARKYQNYKIIIETFDGLSLNDLKNFSIRVMKYSEDLIAIFLNKIEEGMMLLGMMGTEPTKKSDFSIGKFVKESVEKFSGKGGGKKDYGQGFINDKDLSISEVKNYIMDKLNIT
ncbi:MAG: DHHA1 domain-containing protein [Promethearchaeota archaeon]